MTMVRFNPGLRTAYASPQVRQARFSGSTGATYNALTNGVDLSALGKSNGRFEGSPEGIAAANQFVTNFRANYKQLVGMSSDQIRQEFGNPGSTESDNTNALYAALACTNNRLGMPSFSEANEDERLQLRKSLQDATGSYINDSLYDAIKDNLMKVPYGV